MYDIINETDTIITELKEIKKLMDNIVADEKLDSCYFNIVIVDNKKITEINKEYRNIDNVTDVISFALEDEMDIKYDDFRLLGDIYISINKAKLQAKKYNHSLLRELCFLIIHGLLHLLGYDHITDEEEKIMFKKQEELLNRYNIIR